MYAVVFATGLTGLIYQVAWQKYLSRLLGSDSIATAIILATFLGGLSLGYFLCGQMTVRVRNPFRAYALLEGVIGLWCLAFPWIFEFAESLVRTWSFAPPLTIIVQGLLCCALLIGVPTVCMGGTIPFLTIGLSRSLGEATRVHARVYAINTAGAFVGTLLAGFYLIPAFGLPITVKGTAVVNCLAGLFFLLLSATRGKAATSDLTPAESRGDIPPEPSGLRHAPPILYAIAFLSGFYVMTLENVLIRITNLSLGSSSYSFSLIVAAFILAIAIGSSLVGRLRQWPLPLLFINQLGIAVLLLLVYLTLDTWPYWAHLLRISFQDNIAGFWAYYCGAFLVLLAVLVVPVGLMGATVPITFHEVKRDLTNVGRHSGLLFSCNTLGNLTGSLVGGIVLYYFLNNDGVFLTALVLAVISATLAARPLRRRWLVLGGMVAVLVPIIGLFPGSYEKSRFKIGTFLLRHPQDDSFSGPSAFFRSFFKYEKLHFYRDGVSNTVAVTSPLDEQGREQPARSIMVNGKSDSSTKWDTHTLKLLAHIPVLFSRHEPKTAMVVGLGTGVTAGELSLHPGLERIEVAEISPTVIEALPYFGDFTHQVHRDPRLILRHGDAFRIIGRSQEKWDIIISEPSNPWVTGVDMLFTDRFYQEVQPHLSDGGVFLQWVQIYNTSREVVGMIVRTISEKFPFVRVFVANPGDLLFVASHHDLSAADLDRAEKLWQSNPAMSDSLASVGIASLNELLLREVWSPEYIRENFQHYEVQSMDHPKLHYLAGKHFFFGNHVKLHSLLNAKTAAYWPSYALARRYAHWPSHCFEETVLDKAIAGLKHDSLLEALNPLAEAAALKAVANPECSAGLSFTGTYNDATRALARLIAGTTTDEEDWNLAGIAEESPRLRAAELIGVVLRNRNWIAAYPVDGLVAYLEEGAQGGATPEERNWYLLQKARIITSDGAPIKEVHDLLARTDRDNEGRIRIETKDAQLLEEVESYGR
jgi:spermidine synthase